MNKKLLSVILSGVLMVISAGVFVSCEDYDDDISNLQTQINDLGSTLTALQSQVQAGKWITSVSSTAGGLTIVFSDGTQYTIENGKDGAPGAPGKDGNGTLVEVKDGYWYLNGEKTDYLALTKEDTTGVVGQANVPYVNEEDGYWYFYNEEGEAVKSDYKALGATYAVKDANTGVWTLHVPDADGTMQSIDLPTAAAKITGLTFVNGNKTFNVYKVKWDGFDAGNTGLTASAWAGPKTLPSSGSYIYGATTDNDRPVLVQVSPGDVAKDIEKYTLTNSKNQTLGLALTAEPYNGLVTPAGEKTRAATNGNGLYDITIEPQVVSGATNISALDGLLTAAVNSDKIGYALVADNVFRSAYNIDFTFTDEPSLTTLSVKDNIKDGIIIGTDATTNNLTSNPIKVGTTYTVTFDDPSAVYDSYFTFKDRDISTYGITWDNESKTFSISKNPDVGSLEGQFVMTVYTIDIKGKAQKTEITFHLAAEMSNNMLAAQTVNVTKPASSKRKFQYNLSDVAITGTDAWKQNVDLTATEIEYALYEDEDCTRPDDGGDPGIDGVVGLGKLIEPAVVNAKGNSETDSDKATSVTFTIDNTQAAASGLKLNTTYYLKTTFKTKGANPEVLNTVILPVTFTAPALKDLFVPKDGYVRDGVINAYFYKLGADNSVDLTEFFKDGFVNDAKVKMDNSTNIVAKSGTNYKSKGLVQNFTEDVAFSGAQVDLNASVKKDNGYELGYGEALIVNVHKTNYEGWKYKNGTADTLYSFKIRLMSPIMEGSVKAVGDVIPLKANDVVNGAKITDAMVKGYDYNNTEYNIVPDLANGAGTAAWKNEQIQDITMDPTNSSGYITRIDREAAKNVDGVTINGYFQAIAGALSSTTETTITVNVKDIWNYTKKTDLKVRIIVEE